MPAVAQFLHDLTTDARSLTVRQATALAVAAVLISGLLVAAALGRPATATALVGLLVGLGLAGLVQVQRRTARETNSARAQLTGEITTVRAQVNDLAERLEVVQRQVVANVENERLAGSDRHLELLASLGRIEAALRRLSTGADTETPSEAPPEPHATRWEPDDLTVPGPRSR